MNRTPLEKILTFIVFTLMICVLIKILTIKQKTTIQPIIQDNKCYSVEYQNEIYKVCGEKVEENK